MQTTKAYRKESSVRGKGSAPGCIPKLLFSRPDSALHRGNQALCGRSFTHRCVSVGIKKDPDRVRFIRAILKSKGLSMWSCLPLCLWVSRLGPSSVETSPEKISSRYAFPRGWELGFIGGEKSKPPSGTKGSQPACVLKPLFGRNGLASPKGDLQICSEVGNSRGRVLVPDCPLLALQRYS